MEKDKTPPNDPADYLRGMKYMNSKEIVGSVFGMAFKIIAAVLIVMFVYKYAGVAYEYGYRLFGEQPITSGEGRTVTVTIPEDADAKKVGEILETKGLIRDSQLFVLQELLSDYHGKILAGEFELNTSMTAEQMIAVLSTEPEPETEEGNKTLDEMTEENQGTVVVGSEND